MFVNFFFKDMRMKFTEIKSKKKKWQKSLKMISLCWKINFFSIQIFRQKTEGNASSGCVGKYLCGGLQLLVFFLE